MWPEVAMQGMHVTSYRVFFVSAMLVRYASCHHMVTTDRLLGGVFISVIYVLGL